MDDDSVLPPSPPPDGVPSFSAVLLTDSPLAMDVSIAPTLPLPLSMSRSRAAADGPHIQSPTIPTLAPAPAGGSETESETEAQAKEARPTRSRARARAPVPVPAPVPAPVAAPVDSASLIVRIKRPPRLATLTSASVASSFATVPLSLLVPMPVPVARAPTKTTLAHLHSRQLCRHYPAYCGDIGQHGRWCSVGAEPRRSQAHHPHQSACS